MRLRRSQFGPLIQLLRRAAPDELRSQSCDDLRIDFAYGLEYDRNFFGRSEGALATEA